MAGIQKRPRVSSNSQSESSDGITGSNDKTIDLTELMQRLKQGFDLCLATADHLLKQLPDSATASDIQKQVAGMSVAFSQMTDQMNGLLATGRVEDAALIESQAQEITKLQKRVERLLNPTDGLPEDCIQRIIHFCGLADVFVRCMLVNKQWIEVAKADLKTRKKLKLRCKTENGSVTFVSSNSSYTDPLLAVMKEENQLQVAESLKLMTGVTDLHLTRMTETFHFGVFPLLDSWSANIQSLTVGGCVFPDGHGLSFPRLTIFKSDFLGTNALLSLLPLDQMKRLDVVIPQTQDACDMVCGMKSLTHLRLMLNKSPVGGSDALVARVMTSVRNLAQFVITRPPTPGPVMQMDSAVAELVAKNSNLEQVAINNVVASDASLDSLSRLTKLKRLTICSPADSFSFEAVLNLLTRGAENALKYVVVRGVKALTAGQKETLEGFAHSQDMSVTIDGTEISIGSVTDDEFDDYVDIGSEVSGCTIA